MINDFYFWWKLEIKIGASPVIAWIHTSCCVYGTDGFKKSGKRTVSKAHVAQLVEHVLGKDEVTGSIPVMGSIRNINLENNSKH